MFCPCAYTSPYIYGSSHTHIFIWATHMCMDHILHFILHVLIFYRFWVLLLSIDYYKDLRMKAWRVKARNHNLQVMYHGSHTQNGSWLLHIQMHHKLRYTAQKICKFPWIALPWFACVVTHISFALFNTAWQTIFSKVRLHGRVYGFLTTRN